MDTRNTIFLTIGGIAIIGAALVGGAALFSQGSTVSSQTTPTTTQSAPTTTSSDTTATTSSTTAASQSTTAPTGSFKDGQYSASASYRVPHGSNTISVSLTVKDGKVTVVKNSQNYTDHESRSYIDSFESEISSAVVGQPLGSTNLSRVGGASLTTAAFNDALSQIASDAKA
jgi:uncharacterized protein with FMN-binding domain